MPLTPQDVRLFMVVRTACICLYILVGGMIFGALTGLIDVDAMGAVRGIGIGCGLLGLGSILVLLLYIALREGGRSG